MKHYFLIDWFLLCMKKLLYLHCVLFFFAACSSKTPADDYPVIDVINSAGKYKRVFCSDYFSSLELIPLETNDNCLLEYYKHYSMLDIQIILCNTDYFFIQSRNIIYSFDNAGKFLHQIGRKGQGPREYTSINDIFFNTENTSIFITDYQKILEYDFNGTFIRNFPKPIVENENITLCSNITNNLFIGQLSISSGKNKFKYCIFDENGDTIKCFPNYTFFNRIGFIGSCYDYALHPIRVDDRIYLKDYINDTIYILKKHILEPVYVFQFGKHAFPKEILEKQVSYSPIDKSFIISKLIGTPKYFFYVMLVPKVFPRPKRKPKFSPFLNKFITDEEVVFGIYDITDNTNVLLDTDDDLQRGIINDINGGLPFFPRYYAGDNVVVDIWSAEEMKEMLTEEYFAKQTIRDLQAHQKLKELLENLKEDDNPVVVVAKLK